MAPGADFTDLRCWPSGRRLELSESAGHDLTYLGEMVFYFLEDGDLRNVRYWPPISAGIVGWFSMAPGADFTDLRS